MVHSFSFVENPVCVFPILSLYRRDRGEESLFEEKQGKTGYEIERERENKSISLPILSLLLIPSPAVLTFLFFSSSSYDISPPLMLHCSVVGGFRQRCVKGTPNLP